MPTDIYLFSFFFCYEERKQEKGEKTRKMGSEEEHKERITELKITLFICRKHDYLFQSYRNPCRMIKGCSETGAGL